MFWLKTGYAQAYAHPLFTNQEYAELVAHYRFKPTLSASYRLLLRNELLRKFSGLMLDNENDADAETLSQKCSDYLPTANNSVNELEDEDVALIPLVERSPTPKLSKKD
jgi:predicted dithiol-disulfide oxidoreductase (DUF899 family)